MKFLLIFLGIILINSILDNEYTMENKQTINIVNLKNGTEYKLKYQLMNIILQIFN